MLQWVWCWLPWSTLCYEILGFSKDLNFKKLADDIDKRGLLIIGASSPKIGAFSGMSE